MSAGEKGLVRSVCKREGIGQECLQKWRERSRVSAGVEEVNQSVCRSSQECLQEHVMGAGPVECVCDSRQDWMGLVKGVCQNRQDWVMGHL